MSTLINILFYGMRYFVVISMMTVLFGCGGGGGGGGGTTNTTYSLTVGSSGSGVGQVVSDPTGIVCGSTCTTDFNSGSSVMLQPLPGLFSRFVTW